MPASTAAPTKAVFNLPFEVEHITPRSHGGDTAGDNLALSCRSSNLYKCDSVSALDDLTQTEARIFNPRRDLWDAHFSIVSSAFTAP